MEYEFWQASKNRQESRFAQRMLPDGLYCELVYCTGRCIREDKAGHIEHHQQPILDRLGINSEQWLTLTTEFEQTSGPGQYNIVTMVERQSQHAIYVAKVVVQQQHAKTGFNPQQTIERLGIQADIANYTLVD